MIFATLLSVSFAPLLVAQASISGNIVINRAVTKLSPKTLKVTNGLVSPDGFKRSAILVNGQHPAPLLTGKKGTKFRFNVENALTDPTMQRPTSIHWHGFLQRGTNYADGPSGVSQCPISPNHSFLYEFSADDQAGTYWYHSHFPSQYCDGLRGPLVVYDDHDPHRLLYQVDDENTIITLSEWFHTPSPSLQSFLAHSTLINGKGRFPGGPAAALSVVNVEWGKRYRLRLISIACQPNFMFSIDGHAFLVIEADGQNIIPYFAERVQIFVGQRYSLVLHAKEKIDNYWIRALPNIGKGDLPNNFNGGTNSAILRYKGAKMADPKIQPNPTGKLLEESELRPLDILNSHAPGSPRPGGADVNINLDIGVNFETLHFLVNNHTYAPPSVPVLLQMLSMSRTPQELMPVGSIYPLPRNKVIEITIPGGAPAGPHPFHLHGHAFSVIKSAGNGTKPNYVNPVRRDVVSIGDVGSNVTIRFVTDNPGPWLLHCHIDFHLEFGLAVVFAEDQADVREEIHPPADWSNLCKTFNALPPSATSITQVSEVP